MPDDNDFLGSSFSNYDTTENRMSDSGVGRGRSGRSHGGNDIPTWKVVVGLIWGIIFTAIAISNNGRAGNPDNPAIALLSGLISPVGMLWIICGKAMAEGRRVRKRLDAAIADFTQVCSECKEKQTEQALVRKCKQCGSEVFIIGKQECETTRYLCLECNRDNLRREDTIEIHMED